MAQDLKRSLACFVVAGSMLSLMSTARAQQLVDPTKRPRIEAAGSEAAVKAPAAVSIIVSSASNVTAVIDGRVVRAGDRIDAGLITHITNNAVCIKSNSGNNGKINCLPLYPDVHVQGSAPAAAAAQSAAVMPKVGKANQK